MLTLLMFSCEKDEMVMNAEFETEYSLNCVLSGLDSTQYVTIMRSYETGVDGITPAIEDPYVKNAEVKIRYKDLVLFFNEATKERNDTSRFNTPVTYYVLENFTPEFGEEVKIEAVLMSGRRLTSITTVPTHIVFNLQNLESDDPEKSIPGNYTNDVKITWTNPFSGLFYLPKINIIYFVDDGMRDVWHSYEVPINYDLIDGDYIPVYAEPSQGGGVTFTLDAFRRAMTLLSEGDPIKTKYRIYYMGIDVIIYDQNLSAYYASTGREADEYSIKLQELDYSNIDNGYGIFGSYIKQSNGMAIEENYIKSFGYVPFDP